MFRWVYDNCGATRKSWLEGVFGKVRGESDLSSRKSLLSSMDPVWWHCEGLGWGRSGSGAP